jgi:hypothetical protein
MLTDPREEQEEFHVLSMKMYVGAVGMIPSIFHAGTMLEVSGLLQTLVILGRGKQTQVLTGQGAGWTQRKENSPMPTIKPPFLAQPAIHFASTLSQSAHTVSTQTRTFNSSSFKDYKTLHNNNTLFPSIWTAVQIVTESNREGRKTFSQTAV